MKPLKLSTGILIFACLFVSVACQQGGVKNYPIKNEAKTDTVKINDCVATPDLADVPNGTHIHWVVGDDATYVVGFDAVPPPIPLPGAPPVVSKNLLDPPHAVNTGCSSFHPSHCGIFGYTLTEVAPTQRTCQDPGIRIVPQ